MRCDTLSVCLSVYQSVRLCCCRRKNKKRLSTRASQVASLIGKGCDRLWSRPSEHNKESSFFKAFYFKVRGSFQFSSFIGPNESRKLFVSKRDEVRKVHDEELHIQPFKDET